MSRNLCGVHLGASYQYSPETISSLPSPLMSAKAAVSLAPLSIITFSNGTSAGREMLHSVKAHAAASANVQIVFLIAMSLYLRTSPRWSTLVRAGSRWPTSDLWQFPAFAARPVGGQQVGLFVADHLFFFRIPTELALQLERQVGEMAHAHRTVPDFDVGVRPLTRRDALEPVAHVVLGLPQGAFVVPLVDLFLRRQVERDARRVDLGVGAPAVDLAFFADEARANHQNVA